MIFKLALVRENLPSVFAHNNDADQPAHPRRLISAFVIHLLKNSISKLDSSKILVCELFSIAEETDLTIT